MDKHKIERINELARKAKAGELTSEETAERVILRKEYVNAFKTNLRSTLDNALVENEKGEYEPLKKLNPEEIVHKKEEQRHDDCGCGHHHHHHHETCGCGHHHGKKTEH